MILKADRRRLTQNDPDGLLELLLLSDVRSDLERLMFPSEIPDYLRILLAPQTGPDGRPYRRARMMIDHDVVATRGAFLDALDEWSAQKYGKRDAATKRSARLSRQTEAWR